MSIETIQPINPDANAETPRVHEQPLGKSDAIILPQHEIDDEHRDVLYLSSAAILAHERALLSEMQAEVVALAEKIRQTDITLARIGLDFYFVKEQISDLGYSGVPQMTMQKDLEAAYQTALVEKASLASLYQAKREEITALKAHQERREWSMSGDY